jgi:Na+:H+ antiporter, NhaA family
MVRAYSSIRQFLKAESAAGIILMVVAVAAVLVANSPLSPAYFGALKTYVFGLSVQHWINDALMAVFFLLVGLEIKREFLNGQLSSWSRRALPGFAALGGMIVPALIYVGLNAGSPETLRGWAIPAATDIAFALGVLALLGSRVPVSLKIFLTALAILDDLGAVIIIAVFYTAKIDLAALAAALAVVGLLAFLNMRDHRRLSTYLALGAILWFLVLKSGVHATLAGVALALTIPHSVVSGAHDDHETPLLKLEHGLHPWVAFLIVPVFGFANAGVSFAGMGLSALLEPVPLGIALGLFIGKQVGVFGFAWLAIRSGLAERPAHATWMQVYGVSLLCGIGFTMSLFIGLLAFPMSADLQDQTKIGVLAGSLVSGVIGWLVLRLQNSHPEPVAVRLAQDGAA